MPWRVDILNDSVREEIRALPSDIRAKFVHISNLIEQFGLHGLREPYVKHLVGKLWEMRMKGRDGIARALYITATGERVVVLRAFLKKTQKTPVSELEIALRRAKEVS